MVTVCTKLVCYTIYWTCLGYGLVGFALSALVFLYTGPLPTKDLETGSTIFAFSSAISVIFTALALVLLKYKNTSHGPAVCCCIGLTAALALNGYTVYIFSRARLTPEEMESYSRDYAVTHGEPPPFFQFLQSHVPCCGVSSYRDFLTVGETKEGSFSLPSTCCSRNSTTCEDVNPIMLEIMRNVQADSYNDEEWITDISSRGVWMRFLIRGDFDALEWGTPVDDRFYRHLRRKLRRFAVLAKNVRYGRKYGSISDFVVKYKFGHKLQAMINRIDQGSDRALAILLTQRAIMQLAREEYLRTLEEMKRMNGSDPTLRVQVLGCGTFLNDIRLLEPYILPRWLKMLSCCLRCLHSHRKLLAQVYLLIGYSLNSLALLACIVCHFKLAERRRGKRAEPFDTYSGVSLAPALDKMRPIVLVIGGVLSLNTIFGLIMFGHCISIYTYFHGPPPNKDYQVGHITLTISLIIALASSSLAFFVVQFDLKSFVVAIAINIGFILALIGTAIVIYSFRDPQPTAEKFREYTVEYYRQYKKPPPFMDKLQRTMGGYCCGASSYLEYVADPSSEFFDVPHTCCFTHLRRTDPACGKHRWKYLYMFLSSILSEAMNKLEQDYEDLEDLSSVQRKLARSKAQHFIDTHIRDMFKDRVASTRKNMNSTKYNRIRDDEYAQNNGGNLASSISDRIYNEAEVELKELKMQILNMLHVSFVPMGCWALMDELQKSNWRGFQRFREVRARIRAIFQGVLAMNIVNLILLVLAAIGFNYFYYFASGSGSSKSVEADVADEEDKTDNAGVSESEFTEYSDKSRLLDENTGMTGVSDSQSEAPPLETQESELDDGEENLIGRTSYQKRRSQNS